MLACARIGAVHFVVFGGFSPDGLGDTSTLAEPAVVDDLVGNRHNKKKAAAS